MIRSTYAIRLIGPAVLAPMAPAWRTDVHGS